jgi:2-iminobutanoate/2-iminopropanoate deaminase
MPKYPKPVGPYSPYKIAGDIVFLAGQIGINPDTGELEEGLEAQTERVLTNIANVLAELGLSLDHVVKTTIFLRNMGDFQKVNEIYARYFKENFPARSTVEVSNLPKGALIEIEAIAYIPKVEEEVKRGLELFLEGKFFESHEYWEKAWRRLEEPTKSHLRALINLDAFFIKLAEGNKVGAKAHLERFLNLAKDGKLKEKLEGIYGRLEEVESERIFEEIKGDVTGYLKDLGF